MLITFHLGFEKTATSLIQEQLKFGRNSFGYIGHDIKDASELNKLNIAWNDFVLSRPGSYKNNQARHTFKKEIKRVVEFGVCKHLVVSDERPGSVFDFNLEFVLVFIEDLLRETDDLILNSFVFTTREKADWLVSHMSYHFLKWWLRNILTPEDFIENAKAGDKYLNAILSHVENSVGKVQKFFPSVPVISIPYELINNHPDEWIKLVNMHLGTKVAIYDVNRNRSDVWVLNNHRLIRRGLKKFPVKTVKKIMYDLVNGRRHQIKNEFTRLDAEIVREFIRNSKI